MEAEEDSQSGILMVNEVQISNEHQQALKYENGPRFLQDTVPSGPHPKRERYEGRKQGLAGRRSKKPLKVFFFSFLSR